MRIQNVGLFALLMALNINICLANELTPADEPKDDSFYVCYEKRCLNTVSSTPLLRYKSYKYIGCVISRLPCDMYCVDKSCHPPKRLKQFYWYNNYYDALNSFYRCAYS